MSIWRIFDTNLDIFNANIKNLCFVILSKMARAKMAR